jgi:hypothetical protein
MALTKKEMASKIREETGFTPVALGEIGSCRLVFALERKTTG